jgi:WD40 repeat protein
MNEQGMIVTGGKDGSVGLVNTNSKKVIAKIKVGEESVESVAFCKEMNWFVAGNMAGEVRVYEVDSLAARCVIQAGAGVVKCLWSGFEVFVGGLGGMLAGFDGRSGVLLRKLSGPSDTVLDFDVKQ